MLERTAAFRARGPQFHIAHSGSQTDVEPLSERPDWVTRQSGLVPAKTASGLRLRKAVPFVVQQGGRTLSPLDFSRGRAGAFGRSRARGGHLADQTRMPAPLPPPPESPFRGFKRAVRRRRIRSGSAAASDWSGGDRALCYAADWPAACGSKP
jgi:hypothetical protein